MLPLVVDIDHVYPNMRLPLFILVFSSMPLFLNKKMLKVHVFYSLFMPL